VRTTRRMLPVKQVAEQRGVNEDFIYEHPGWERFENSPSSVE